MGLILLERFCHSQTDGFRLPKATTSYDYPFFSHYEPPPTTLYQSFHYLGCGVQFYVFLGEDKQTILKLFKHYHAEFSHEFVKGVLPRRLAASIIEKRERLMIRSFKSAEIALKHLPKETGVLYTHLNKTDHSLGKIKIYDKLGILHEIDLDQTEFVIQKRGIGLPEGLHNFFKTKQIDEAIYSMQGLVTLMENRSKKGIKNRDGAIFKNCGFIDGAPAELDIGSYIYAKDDYSKKTTKRTIQKLLEWVEMNYPQNLSYCKERLLKETASAL